MAHHYKIRTLFLGDEGMDLAALEKRFGTPTPLAVPEAQRQTPLARLMVRASELIAEHLAQREVTYRQQFFGWDEDEIGYPPPTEPTDDQVIDVVLYAHPAFATLYDVDENALGFNAITDPLSPTGYAEDRRVFVRLSPERFLELALEQRQQEADPDSSKYDHEFMASTLVTIAHELVHAIEWVEHSNGVNLPICEMTGLYAGEISGGYGVIEEATSLFDDRPEGGYGSEDPYFQALITSDEWAEQRAEEEGCKMVEAVWDKLTREKSFQEVFDWMNEELAIRLSQAPTP